MPCQLIVTTYRNDQLIMKESFDIEFRHLTLVGGWTDTTQNEVKFRSRRLFYSHPFKVRSATLWGCVTRRPVGVGA